MAVVAISDSILTDIADAIRSKNGTENTYKPSQMSDAIEAISGGGITPTGTKQISVTQNGTTTEDVTNYASAEIAVNVPTGGGSGLELIDTIQVSNARNCQINIDANWLDDYLCVLIVPDLTVSASDWIYVKVDGTTGGDYTDKITTFGDKYTMILSGNSSSSTKRITYWKSNSSMLNIVITEYIYVYAYTSSVTMNGTFKIYGVAI